MQDAPAQAAIFIEQTCSGELPLDRAKNLLMAFSRLRNKIEKKVSEKEKEIEVEDTSEYEEETN